MNRSSDSSYCIRTLRCVCGIEQTVDIRELHRHSNVRTECPIDEQQDEANNFVYVVICECGAQQRVAMEIAPRGELECARLMAELQEHSFLDHADFIWWII